MTIQPSIYDLFDELKQDQKPRMSARQQEYYDKWHPDCERNGKSSVARLEDIELKLEDL